MIALPNDQLLVSVVRKGWGDRIVNLAKEAGARGSTVIFGRGTARNRFLQLLGLADTEKELIFTLASRGEMADIINILRSKKLSKKNSGVGLVLSVITFLRAGTQSQSENRPEDGDLKMGPVTQTDTKHQLICVIVNTGYGDDIMLAARKAGARGGTIVKARGTGTEQDSSFFGITIVPEKEMILILVKREIGDKIMQAIRSSKYLSEPGVGIVFKMPVEDFFPLGLKTSLAN